MNPLLVRVALLIAGFALWAIFSVAPASDGHLLFREAWDQELYWRIGVPLLIIAHAALAASCIEKPSLLALWPLAGHVLGMILVHRSGTDFALLPLTFLFIGVPFYGALFVASLVGRQIVASSR
jgi:hypothetical protein